MINFLRTHRLKSALSQDEVAFLIGLQAGANVSRHESGERVPELFRALSYSALYGVPVEELFREELEGREVEIRKRTSALLERVEKEPESPVRDRKIETLRSILAGNQKEV